jgi:Dolichyl-phosphate-mannose-protein mannosyltransferase
MSLLIGLPLAAYALLFLLADPAAGRRAAAIHAAVMWGAAVAAITEILSLFHAIAAPELAAAWLLMDLAAAGYLWRRQRVAPLPWRALFRGALAQLDGLEIALLAGVLCLLAGVVAAALIAPPNTTDAMVYHLPRIVHWLHNRSVAFYATHEIRQLQMPPWAEYAMLQFHGLSGGDRFDNLVQCFSLGGCLLGVSLIAEMLGAGLRGQVLAAVVCATIPQALLEASGAKNDCVTAFWLVALVWYLFRFGRDTDVRSVCGIGAALGLACLTKSTALVIAPPLMAALLLVRVPGQPKGIWRRGLTLACLLALALNAPQFVRNYRLFHSILGPSAGAPPDGYRYTNDTFGAGPLLSNVLRNLALHASTPLGSVNHAVEAGVVRILGTMGENANDPRTTWDYTEFHVPPLNLHEAIAGNPQDALLILLVCGILLWHWKAAPLRSAWLLAVGLAAAFLLFCEVFRWQPWHTRLHLPFFVLWSAVIGTVLAGYCSRGAIAALGVLLLLSAAPDVFANQLRPIAGGAWNIFSTPREDLYFADLSYLKTPYQQAAQFVESSHCPEIGLDLSQTRNEYPLYALLHDLTGSKPIRNAYVTNASRVYDAATDVPPACLICPDCALGRPGWVALAGQYRSVKLFGNVSVLSDPAAGASAGGVCTTEFPGWYSLERSGADWWRWSSGKGVVHVKAAKALHADLEAEVFSIRYPNQVEFLLNGERVALLHETAVYTTQLILMPVELRQGDNTLEFLSANPPVQLPTDPRQMAIALKNLAFRTNGGTVCVVDPN